eukprot:TRINITY_DN49440_c0_g1_i1.p1 TRINITY_DN49440_c0_g1~~TRINITY_DN49440_c0_g1_i1.p1  ORF type:complete len:426 (+),score=117.06 TRINITY_DN49440_c0_g1_i1:102-1379(+)
MPTRRPRRSLVDVFLLRQLPALAAVLLTEISAVEVSIATAGELVADFPTEDGGAADASRVGASPGAAQLSPFQGGSSVVALPGAEAGSQQAAGARLAPALKDRDVDRFDRKLLMRREVAGETVQARVGQREGIVPADLDAWEKLWRSKMLEEETKTDHFKEALPKHIKMAVAVMSCPGDERIRDIIRQTWMRQPGVCPLHAASREDGSCSMHIVFVVGGGAGEPQLQDDVLKVEAVDGHRCYGERNTENFCGLRQKVIAFLRYSADNFRWATHVGRVDQDYFPHFRKTLPYMAKKYISQFPFQYLGRRLNGFDCYHSPQEIAEQGRKWPGGLVQVKFADGSVHKQKQQFLMAYCVQGSMYFLSRPLAEVLTGPKMTTYLDFTAGDCYHDDQWLGQGIAEFIRITQQHVDVVEDKYNYEAFPGIDS